MRKVIFPWVGHHRDVRGTGHHCYLYFVGVKFHPNTGACREKLTQKKQSMKKKQKRQLEQNKRSLFVEQRSIVRIVLGTKSGCRSTATIRLGWRLGLQISLGAIGATVR